MDDSHSTETGGDKSVLSDISEEETDDEDDDDNMDDELKSFRRKWQDELTARTVENPSIEGGEKSETTEEQARRLFMMGVNAEQNYQLYDAIGFYRKAVQLVPDIEQRIDELKYKRKRRKSRARQESESSVGSTSSMPEDEDYDVTDLSTHFNRLGVSSDAICQPNEPQHETHISILPVELMVYVFKWVVSSELDITSLERLSQVCRGFYVCARDDELWKLICSKVWGIQTGELGDYGNWRQMYVSRPHIRFNGVYISKCSYYRLGEQSMDGFYKPFFLVEYFRLIRFFPEGQVLMLSSPDEPSQLVSRMRSRAARVQGILHGYYRLAGDQLTAVLKRRKTSDDRPKVGYYKYRRPVPVDSGEQTFHVVWQLKQAGKRQNSQLLWQHYSAHTLYKGGEETISEFELGSKMYPPLIFSGVRSYNVTSEKPLS